MNTCVHYRDTLLNHYLLTPTNKAGLGEELVSVEYNFDKLEIDEHTFYQHPRQRRQ